MYLGHRRFLPNKHPVRKKGKHFKGEADHRTKPTYPIDVDIYDMVKDLKVIFEKGHGGQSVPNDALRLALRRPLGQLVGSCV